MKIEDHIREILKFIGEDPTREDLIETPRRIVESYKEFFAGYKEDPKKILKTFTNGKYEEMILVRNIDYFSMCEHHMIPFFGKADIAYIPDKHITGLSKLARLVEVFAKRLQNQEHMTVQIAKTLFEVIKPKGVAVHVSGKHLCMCGRGVHKANAETVTTSFLGTFKTDSSLKSDFFSQIQKS